MKSVFGKHSCCFLVFFRPFSARRFQFASFWRHGSKGEIKLVQLSNDWQFPISGLSIKTFKNALFSGTKNWGCPGVPVHGGIPIVFISIHRVVTQFVNVSFLCVSVHEDTTKKFVKNCEELKRIARIKISRITCSCHRL